MTIDVSWGGSVFDAHKKYIQEAPLSKIYEVVQERFTFLSEHGPVNPLSLFIETKKVQDFDKKEMLLEVCSEHSFLYEMKNLFTHNFHDFVEVMRFIENQKLCVGIIGWILLRVPTYWPAILSNYLIDDVSEYSDQQRKERCNFLLSIICDLQREVFFRYLLYKEPRMNCARVFFSLENRQYQEMMVSMCKGKSRDDFIDDLITYSMNLLPGKPKVEVKARIRELLIGFMYIDEGSLFIGIPSPMVFLFVMMTKKGSRSILKEIPFWMYLEKWCRVISNNLDAVDDQNFYHKFLKTLLGRLPWEYCLQLVNFALKENLSVASTLLLCSPLPTLKSIRRDNHSRFEKIVEQLEGCRFSTYQYVNDTQPVQSKYIMTLYSKAQIAHMPLLVLGLHVTNEHFRNQVLNEISGFNDKQIKEIALAWPKNHFNNKLYSLKTRLSLRQYRMILDNCSRDHLRGYLNFIGNKLSRKLSCITSKYSQYLFRYDDYCSYSIGRVFIRIELINRATQINKELSEILNDRDIHMLMKKSDELTNHPDEWGKGGRHNLIIKTYISAKRIFSEMPVVW